MGKTITMPMIHEVAEMAHCSLTDAEDVLLECDGDVEKAIEQIENKPKTEEKPERAKIKIEKTVQFKVSLKYNNYDKITEMHHGFMLIEGDDVKFSSNFGGETESVLKRICEAFSQGFDTGYHTHLNKEKSSE